MRSAGDRAARRSVSGTSEPRVDRGRASVKVSRLVCRRRLPTVRDEQLNPLVQDFFDGQLGVYLVRKVWQLKR